MKTAVYTVLLLTLGCVATQAKLTVPVVGKSPEATFGVKVGGNFEQLNGKSWETAYKPGIVFGAFGAIQKKHLGIQAELLVNTSNYSLKDSLSQGAFRMVNLCIPILIEYKVLPRVWVQAGPQFNTLLSARRENIDDADVKKLFNAGNVNLVTGVEVELPLRFSAGCRYILGLSDLNNETLPGVTDAWKTRSIQLHVGFRFL
jgi:hypothetical protein